VTGAPTLHASCVAVGEAGILIRGAAGTGKSTLARAVVSRAWLAGRYAAFVADDRVRITAVGGRIIARPVAAIAGLMEIRGLGIVPVAHEAQVVLRFVVDCLANDPHRLPEAEELQTILAGVALPRLPLAATAEAASNVLFWLSTFDEGLTSK
jgi:serine kinase of HPr protein (carbohydrate metabolism regulator)